LSISDVMISLVWANARSTPGIAPQAAPSAAPATIIAGMISHADCPASRSAMPAAPIAPK
jgi:hypothetical protein